MDFLILAEEKNLFDFEKSDKSYLRYCEKGTDVSGKIEFEALNGLNVEKFWVMISKAHVFINANIGGENGENKILEVQLKVLRKQQILWTRYNV